MSYTGQQVLPNRAVMKFLVTLFDRSFSRTAAGSLNLGRFSEDIDISIDRAALGFTGKRDLAYPDLSNTQRKKLDLELRAAISKEANAEILPKLKASFESVLGKEGWSLSESQDAAEEMTLIFNYPSAFEYRDYLRPSIKIEFGRGDQQPSEAHLVSPYVANEFPRTFALPSSTIKVLAAQRSFWEKVTLLHAENHHAAPLKPRMSRHWSDVAVMSTADRFADANLDVELLRKSYRFQANLLRS